MINPTRTQVNPAVGPAVESRPGGLPGAHAADSARPEPGLKIPDHELIRLIGQGAYGQVWLARNVVGTLRAIKIIFRSQFEDDRPYEREFIGIQKFEPISRSHEGLMDILQIGRDDQAGYFYYVMELADDLSSESGAQVAGSCQTVRPCAPGQYAAKTLRAELRRRARLPVDECIAMGLALTSALEHLHKHGLVHRDIKPSNIIFVNGVPKLADIGLVADLGESKSFVGTLGYIPPEGPGTPQADLYGLGKVLYEMSTGRDRQDFPQLPADLRQNPESSALVEFNEILLKACDCEPSRRYQSAGEMQAELELRRCGRSVKRRRNWTKRLAVAKKAGTWGSLAALLTAAILLLAHNLTERDLRSAVPEVNNLVEQGNSCLHGLTGERVLQAAAFFQQAIEKDPNFVPAHYGLFLTYVFRGAVLGGAELQEPLQSTARDLARIGPNFSESRQAASAVHWSNWRFREAAIDARLGSQMRTASREARANAHAYYGWILLQTGQPEAALAEYQLAEAANPVEPLIHDHLGNPYYVSGQFELALQHYQRAIELEPRHWTGHGLKGKVYEDMGRFAEAIDEFEIRDRKAAGESAQAKKYYDSLRQAVREGGGKRYWERRLELALAKSPPAYYDIATYYARLGKKDQAYEWLKQACEKKSFYEGLMVDRCWDHNDPKFQAIARGTGLLQ